MDARTGRATPVADGFSRPNGLAFSPDERTLYVTDSGFATGRGSEMDVSGMVVKLPGNEISGSVITGNYQELPW